MTKKIYVQRNSSDKSPRNSAHLANHSKQAAQSSQKSWASLLGDKGFIWLVVGAIAISVILILAGKQSPDPNPAAAQPEQSVVQPSKLGVLEKDLETKLIANLTQIEGVGKVQVSVSLSSGLKSDYAANQSVTKRTSKETDNTGGVRETTEVTQNDQLVMPNGVAQPVIIMEERPEVAGVLVIAEGARDPKVREAIHNAVRILLDIPASKIMVQPMGGI